MACLALLGAWGCVEASPPEPGEVIAFTASDGVRLEGEVRGSGPRGVVLAHGFGTDRDSWAGFADLLSEEGYLTLSFDFRGAGGSDGTPDVSRAPEDVLAAASAIRERGARSVVLVGASVGGTAALVAASGAGTSLDGVVTLSAPASFMDLAAPPEVVSRVEEPKLFLAAEEDGLAQANAQAFYEAAPAPKRVEVLVGESHGTDLLEGREAERVRGFILAFLGRYA